MTDPDFWWSDGTYGAGYESPFEGKQLRVTLYIKEKGGWRRLRHTVDDQRLADECIRRMDAYYVPMEGFGPAKEGGSDGDTASDAPSSGTIYGPSGDPISSWDMSNHLPKHDDAGR